MSRYRWGHATEWLLDKISTLESAGKTQELAGLFRSLMTTMDGDEIQDVCQSDMAADGYFIQQPHPDLDRLLARAEAAKLGDDALDEDVHELAQAESLAELNGLPRPVDQEALIAQRERRASEINNGGLAAQVAYLFDQVGLVEAKRIIDLAAT